jgi:hypothetical protein
MEAINKAVKIGETNSCGGVCSWSKGVWICVGVQEYSYYFTPVVQMFLQSGSAVSWLTGVNLSTPTFIFRTDIFHVMNEINIFLFLPFRISSTPVSSPCISSDATSSIDDRWSIYLDPDGSSNATSRSFLLRCRVYYRPYPSRQQPAWQWQRDGRATVGWSPATGNSLTRWPQLALIMGLARQVSTLRM